MTATATAMSQNLANLIREKARLEAPENDNDDSWDEDSCDREDEVRDTIDNIIYERTRVIAITKWGRPVLDRAGLDRLVEGLSDEDKTLVRNVVEDRYEWLAKMYDWSLAGTLAPRHRLSCRDVVAKLKSRGIHVVWEEGIYKIINPTCSQCVFMLPVDGERNGPVDHLLLVDDGKGDWDADSEFAERGRAASRSMMEMVVGKRVASGPTIELVPLLREIYGGDLAVGEEALPLIDDFEGWLRHYLGFNDPQVIEEAEAA
jgi:hypothetical protein